MKLIRHLTFTVLAMLTVIGFSSCKNDAWEELPNPVFEFVTHYWPSTEIKSYSNQNGVQTVEIDDGPTIYFNESNIWIRIDGNGGTLPGVLVYDQLPSPLYTYLEELESVDEVYELSRNSDTYIVTLSDQTIRYDNETGISSNIVADDADK